MVYVGGDGRQVSQLVRQLEVRGVMMYAIVLLYYDSCHLHFQILPKKGKGNLQQQLHFISFLSKSKKKHCAILLFISMTDLKAFYHRLSF